MLKSAIPFSTELICNDQSGKMGAKERLEAILELGWLGWMLSLYLCGSDSFSNHDCKLFTNLSSSNMIVARPVDKLQLHKRSERSGSGIKTARSPAAIGLKASLAASRSALKLGKTM